MKRKIAWPTFAAALSILLAMGGLAVHGTLGLLWQRVEGVHGLLLQAGRERLDLGLERGTARLAELARDPALAAGRGAALSEALGAALDAEGAFSGLLVLDARGEVLAAVGSSAELSSFADALRPRTALEADLEQLMRGAALREELAGLQAPVLHLFGGDEVATFPVASAPLRGARGRSAGTLHGILHRERLVPSEAGAFLADGASVLLVDDAGRLVSGTGEAEGLPDLAAELLATRSDRGPELVFTGRSGWIVASTAPASRFEWTVVVHQPLATLARPLAVAIAP
ncbi:MAG: cache domain-containing protein, partial [Planctomycetota bacterium]